ncbi:MAG: Cna B-type domain-containing protein [Ruminococcus sp.]
MSGSKTWNDADNQDGIRPASITVKLFANGTEAASRW